MGRTRNKVPKDWLLLLVSLSLYAINRFWLRNTVGTPLLGYFLRCHFNDLMGGISFVAVVNIILAHSVCRHIQIRSIWASIWFMLCVGLIWEYVIPQFSLRGTADPLDLLAYMAGGSIYAILASPK